MGDVAMRQVAFANDRRGREGRLRLGIVAVGIVTLPIAIDRPATETNPTVSRFGRPVLKCL